MRSRPAYKHYKDDVEAQNALLESGLASDVDRQTWLTIAFWMYERDATPGEAVRESGLVPRLIDETPTITQRSSSLRGRSLRSGTSGWV